MSRVADQLDNLLSESDFVVVACDMNEETIGVIDARTSRAALEVCCRKYMSCYGWRDCKEYRIRRERRGYLLVTQSRTLFRNCPIRNVWMVLRTVVNS